MKYSSFEVIGGTRITRGSNPYSEFLLGVGKDYEVTMGHIMPSARFSYNDKKNWALMIGFDYTYTKKFIPNSPYIYGNLGFVFQSMLLKSKSDYGFFTGHLGVGYPVTNLHKIEAGAGLTRSNTFYWEVRLRNSIKYRYKKRIKSLQCPPLY